MHPFPAPTPVAAPISDELHTLAIKRAAARLGELDKIRRSLELPVEQLPIVIASYTEAVVTLRAEAERDDLAKRTLRVPMTMSSGPRRFKPNEWGEVIEVPQWLTYRVEEIEIHGDPACWRVSSIKVGNREQSPRLLRPPISGARFRKNGIMSELRLDTCTLSMQFCMVVEYIGANPEGEIFEATLVGTAVMA